MQVGAVDGVCGTVDFGKLLYGQARTLRATLVNDGPHPLPFNVTWEVDRQLLDSCVQTAYAATHNTRDASLQSASELVQAAERLLPRAHRLIAVTGSGTEACACTCICICTRMRTGGSSDRCHGLRHRGGPSLLRPSF